MKFDAGTLLLGFVFSTFGFGLYRWGKKQARILHIGGGVVLMVAPYLCTGVVQTLLVCGGISAALVVATRLGV